MGSEDFCWSRSRNTLGIGVGFFCPTSTPEIQLNHFLLHTPKLGITVEMVNVRIKHLLKQRILAVYQNLH